MGIEQIDMALRKGGVRHSGEYAEAHEAFLKAAELIEAEQNMSEKLRNRFRSRVKYELGVTVSYLGRYEDAINYLKESAADSRRIGDELRGLLADLLRYVTEHVSTHILRSDSIENIRQGYKTLIDLKNTPEEDLGFKPRVEYNYEAHAMEIMFDLGQPQWASFADKVKTHPINRLRPPGAAPETDHYVFRIDARLKMDARDFKDAIAIFSMLLGEAALSKKYPHDYPEPEALHNYGLNVITCPARDYRDLSRSLIATGDAENIQYAKDVIRRGLALPDGAGNKVYKQEIVADLALI